MPIIRCPRAACAQQFQLADATLNGALTCPHCGSVFPFEAPTDPAATAEPDTTPERSAFATASRRGTPTHFFADPTVPTIGRFTDLVRLDEGSFGVVYKAHDPQLDRTVALKVAKPGTLNTPEDVQHFLREARAAAQLRHPHIVPVFDAGQDGGHYYIASAFIAGGSLKSALAKQRCDFGRTAQVVRALAEGFAHAHSLGIVHRDVKPANVMLDDQGEPMLMDFGLAARQGEATLIPEGAIFGTPLYMPPEQAAGKKGEPLPASDQYSLGVIFYEMLTGTPPFNGPTRVLLEKHISAEPSAPRSLNREVPRDLATICLKCLEKEPERRYASCQELADDLRRWLEGEPITARRLSLAERVWRWARKNPALALTGSVAVFAVVSALIVFTVLTGRLAKSNRNLTQALNDKHRAFEEKSLEKRHSDHRLYISDMRLAENAWEENQIVRLRELLEGQCPEKTDGFDHRGFEWYYWQRLSHMELQTLEGHTNEVSSVAFSPDGKRIVSSSHDHTVKVWDAGTGRESLTLKGHTSRVYSVAFNPDGKRIVSGAGERGESGEVKVWDAVTGQETLSLKGNLSAVSSVAFSPDGKRLVSSHDQTVKVWDAVTGQETLSLKGHTLWVYSVAFSPDGKRLVSGAGERGEPGEVKVWDAVTGQETLALQGHTSAVFSVAFSADGKRIVSGGHDQTVKVWDAVTGQNTLTLKGHTDAVCSVAFSADGTRIVSGGEDNLVKVWDAGTGQNTLTLKGHIIGVTSVAFSPDGTRIVSGGRDNLVKVWDAGTRRQEFLTLKGHTNLVTSVAFSPDGKRIVSGSWDNTVKVWDAGTGQETLTLQGHTEEVASVAFSPDGKRIVSGSGVGEPFRKPGEIKLWDAGTGQETLTLQGHTGPVYSVAFSPDSKRIVSSGDHTVRVWDAGTGQELLSLQGHIGAVASVAFSPDGKRIVSGGGGFGKPGELKVWDAASGHELLGLQAHTDGITSVAFSPDGKRLLSGSADNTVKVWDASGGQETLTLKGHTNNVTSVAFSADGKRIVSGSEDRTVRVWDADTGQETLNLKGHAVGVTSVAFSPHGNRIVSGGRDKTLKVWNTSRSE